jgi:hypothetical protein
MPRGGGGGGRHGGHHGGCGRRGSWELTVARGIIAGHLR